MEWKVTVQPAVEPLTLTEAKKHLKVPYTNEDTLITSMIQAAREEVERYCNIALITQTIEESFIRFPATNSQNQFSKLWLSVSPVISVSQIDYTDTDNAPQTLTGSKYGVATKSTPGYVYPAYNENWPATLAIPEAVTITYTAGYGATAADVPQGIKAAMKLMIADWYEKRQDDPQTPFVRKVGAAENILIRIRDYSTL